RKNWALAPARNQSGYINSGIALASEGVRLDTATKRTQTRKNRSTETTMDNLQNQNSPLQGFEALESFISSFLLCDDHQLTILALWIANTWCFSRFHTIPYLDIRSPESQCGKSLCLKLLELLACEPALVTAADPSTLLHRLLDKRSLSEFRKNIAEIKKNIENSNYPRFPMTFLIDDCHHSFGPSERQPIVALLNCG